MAGTDETGERTDRWTHLATTFDRVNPFETRVVGVVVGITVVALALRLVALGYRVMHFDEARVAYWILEANRTGDWRYRYIIHGPFVQHVNRYLFALFGNSEFVARLPVALVSTLLPLSALLFREHLEDREIVGLAVLFTLNPILLYYSRFMRSDMLVATFSILGFGFLIRLLDTNRARYLYGATVVLALAFASKENAVVYWLCWAGLLGAVAVVEFGYPRRYESRRVFVEASRTRGSAVLSWLESPASRPWVGHVLTSLVIFGLVTVFLFAPRSASQASIGLWHSSPGAILDGTISALERGFDHWLGKSSGPPACLNTAGDSPYIDRYICTVGRQMRIISLGAPVLGVLSLIGFVGEFRGERPRVLVEGSFYWGIASLVGYPLGTDIMYPGWLPIHALVALAIPAGVGLALVVRYVREAAAEGDSIDTAIGVVLVGVVVIGIVGPAVQYSYIAPQTAPEGQANVIQFAQPSGYMQDELARIDELAASQSDFEVIVYGSVLTDGQTESQYRPACINWWNPTLPLSYYLYQSGATVRCAETESDFESATANERPKVVITVKSEADEIRGELGDEYVSGEYGLRLWSSDGQTVVFFFHTDVAPQDLRQEQTPT